MLLFVLDPNCRLGKRNAFKLLDEGTRLSLGGQLRSMIASCAFAIRRPGACFWPNFGPAAAAPAAPAPTALAHPYIESLPTLSAYVNEPVQIYIYS